MSEDARSPDGIAHELVYRVAKTPSGYKVTKLDGQGLAPGICTKAKPRYFYDDDGEEKAHEYARRKAEESANARIVKLGERL